MADFSPEARNSAIWATDARRIVSGRSADVWLEKTGQKPLDDLSEVEAVEWGLRLQDPIARAVGDRLDVRLKELDIEGTHRQHQWMRSHFDYVSEDNKTLYEIKNYNAFKRDKYGDDGSQIVPAEDFAQCIHEAAVFGVDRVVLCVLFGGQELVTFPFDIDNAQKEVLIQQEAELWAQIQTRTPPDATDPEDLRRIFTHDDGREIMASGVIEMDAIRLKAIKQQITALEVEEKKLIGSLQRFIGTASVLVGADGKPLVTWKKAKDSIGLDKESLEKTMPWILKQFTKTIPGSRRFLVK